MATRAKAKTPARKPAAKTGRPSKYKPEFAEQAAKLCALGATDADLATFFNVAVSTVQLWKVVHPTFSDSLKSEKSRVDDAVERSLLQRALGYEHDEVDIRVINGKIVKTPIRKRYAPDPTSMIFWLKNRRAEQWRATPDEGGVDAPLPVKVVIEVKDASIPEPG